MALVAAHDWQPNDMENRQQRQHVSNASGAPTPQDSPGVPAAAQQPPYGAPGPYGYAAHPQQGPWNMGGMPGMNMNLGQPGYFPQMQYYPQHYGQAPPQMHQQGSPYGAPAQGMFDPNAQFAQWAYQQMMFNAQQQQQQHPLPIVPPQQQQQQGSVRGRSGSHASSAVSTPTNEYYQAPFGHNRYQPGTGTPPLPPPPQNQNNNGGSSSYQGFHPYRRPDRGDRRPRVDNASSPVSNTGSGNSVPFTPPYARSDAAGSTSSVNSTSSQSQRSRTNSGTSANGSVRQSQHVPRPSQASSSPPVARGSSSSTPTSSVPTSSSNAPTLAPRAARPSPLSQGSILSAAERRKSRDDSDLAAMMSSTSIGGLDGSSPVAMPAARNGLKGRLRRAFSLNAAQTLREEEEENAKINGKKTEKLKDADTETEADGASLTTKKTKKSLRIFNSRFNTSTDNISLSSTVSSASVMIRKLGSMGRLARRNSLAGITSLFKDKDKDKDLEGDEEGAETDKKGKKLKGKGKKAEASVSHATAEVDRSADWSAPGMEGLSPAAKLARQHTLKSNAEAAARAKAQQEAQAAASAAASAQAGVPVPTTWEQNTATRHGIGAGAAIREDGMRVVVEEDDSEDEGAGRRGSEDLDIGSASDEDSTWHGHGHDEDEDVTVRMGGDREGLDEVGSGMDHGDDDEVLSEPWALNIRRSIERARRPSRGILKNAGSYSQEPPSEGPSAQFAARMRANSYDSVPTHTEAAGPLARMPSPDPDHIDGLHRHGSHRSANGSSIGKESSISSGPPMLPPLTFDSATTSTSSLTTEMGSEKRSSVYNHPGLNNSEPTLSTMTAPTPPTLTHRAVTTPAKRLAFASNLSVYDTFSPTMYDRRSEPATWSRLTPALAQRIKEELNSYKMEEMEVHSASRIHTQFFV